MIGKLERGEVATVCEVKPHEGGHRGRLSIPGWGTKYTSVYPAREDAIAALVDLRAEAFPSLSEAARDQATGVVL
jgi:hypothetical protein